MELNWKNLMASQRKKEATSYLHSQNTPNRGLWFIPLHLITESLSSTSTPIKNTKEHFNKTNPVLFYYEIYTTKISCLKTWFYEKLVWSEQYFSYSVEVSDEAKRLLD